MLELNGLIGNNPQAALAAFGLLRILGKHGVDARLRWRLDTLTPVLEGVDGFESIVEVLSGYLAGREAAAEFRWADSIKTDESRKAEPSEEGGMVTLTQYQRWVAEATPDQQDWLAAYWCETREGLQASDLDMTAGKVKFFENIRKLLLYLQRRESDVVWRETLLDLWRYRPNKSKADNIASLGWDPAAVKAGAVFAGDKAPDKALHTICPGAQWLAVEALPLLPMLEGRTTGMCRGGFGWPLWREPLGLEAVACLLLVQRRMGKRELKALGVERWVSSIGRNGKYGFLRAGVRVSHEDENPEARKNDLAAFRLLIA